jgi:hypothetical protein
MTSDELFALHPHIVLPNENKMSNENNLTVSKIFKDVVCITQ